MYLHRKRHHRDNSNFIAEHHVPSNQVIATSEFTGVDQWQLTEVIIESTG
jgi:hypothetical protein